MTTIEAFILFINLMTLMVNCWVLYQLLKLSEDLARIMVQTQQASSSEMGHWSKRL